MDNTCFDFEQAIKDIAGIASANASQVRSAVELLDAGNTIPFISRYRKEATGGLDEIALRVVEDEMSTARDMAKLARYVIRAYPNYYGYFATSSFNF